MAILSITPGITGLSGVTPNLVLIDTNDTVGTVTTAGYLNHAQAEGLYSFSNYILAAVSTLSGGTVSTSWYKVVVTGTPGAFVYSLVSL